MFTVFKTSWALLLGMLLLMIGNGLQSTVLGIRGAIEGFDATTMSWVMSAYFLGFLGGSRLAPHMIRRVGHVRVFAALGSLISAGFILYGAIPDAYAWAITRLVVGFCFAGLYVVAESWLNDSATNETRGQALSLYMIVQTLGIVVSQASINLADPAGWNLFVAMSVLVSISFAPILLTVSPAPPFAATKRMTMRELFDASPLGMMGAFLLGFVFAAMFGMGAVYGTEAGLGVGQISLLVAAFYVGGLLFQFPVGVISDRMDRRRLILFLTAGSFGATMLAWPFLDLFPVVLLLAGLIGGVANPLYALMIAHTADHLEPEDMAAASSGLLFVNGVGAVAGPFLVGGMMALVGPDGYFLFLGLLLGLIAAYTGYRMTRRAAVPVEESASFAPVMPQATPVAMEIATELAIEDLEENAARADDPA